MATRDPQQHYNFTRNARNVGLSALIAASIGGYALYQRTTSQAAITATLAPTPGVSTTSAATAAATNATPTPTATTTPAGQYQDGEYTGDSVSAEHFGDVQVQAIISNGQLINFKILDYPYERSTSERISQIAIPYLMQEAVQAQSASIDLISGATFTSEAFIESLQSALDSAVTVMVTPTGTSTAGSSS